MNEAAAAVAVAGKEQEKKNNLFCVRTCARMTVPQQHLPGSVAVGGIV